MSTPTDSSKDPDSDKDLAADLIRQKIAGLYKDEPNAAVESAKAEASTHRSKHQRFMHELNQSGKSVAEIQTAWHQYYQALSEKEKHEVWQEFYSSQGPKKSTDHVKKEAPELHHQSKTAHHSVAVKPVKKKQSGSGLTSLSSVGELKGRIVKKASGSQKLSRKQHLQSLFFGLGVGAAVLFVMLFGFFNERFIAPFVTPSKAVSNTPIIIDPDQTAVSSEPKIIIPKINVEIPVVYDEPSTKEPAIQAALERGVVHYATTPSPGEKGNAVIVGHSSNNILNKGKYKFAFVLLKRLEPGDTIILNKDKKRYVYKVFEKKIVKPTDVSVLGETRKPATVTLITCDPPGTSINRLVVVAEQISPDPGKNKASSAVAPDTESTLVPGNAPSLWSRLTGWLTGSNDQN